MESMVKDRKRQKTLTGEPTFGRQIRDSFVAGLLVLAPLGITVYILWFVFEHVDAPLGDRLNALLRYVTGLDLHIPGLGILGTALLVLGIGWLTRMALFRYVIRLVEAAIDRVPVVRSLYNASRQIVVPFTDKEILPFSDVVLAEYPMRGRWTIGMISRQQVSGDPGDDRVVVFFPSNHLHLGYPVVLARSEVTVIDMTVEQAVKFFVSCGVIGDDAMFRPKALDLTVPPAPPRATDLAKD